MLGGTVSTTPLNDDNGLVSKETSPAPAGLSTETVETTYSYNDRNPYLLGSMTRGNVSNYYGYDSVNLADLHLSQRVQLQFQL